MEYAVRQSFLTNLALKAIVPLALLAAPLAAHAASSTFSGSGASGVDPAGEAWTAGPNFANFATFTEAFHDTPADTIPSVFQGAGGLTSATSFTFTYTGSQKNPFNTDFDTGFTHVVVGGQGVTWDTTFLSPTTVEFTAPAGDKLDIGDNFQFDVGFNKKIKPADFSFTATWSDGLTGGVPEPTSWALMIGGMGLVGATMRRRRQALAA
jgi:hypothetical protein